MKRYGKLTFTSDGYAMIEESPDGLYYLASDVDARDKRIREALRGRIARYITVSWNYSGSAYERADLILAEVFKDGP